MEFNILPGKKWIFLTIRNGITFSTKTNGIMFSTKTNGILLSNNSTTFSFLRNRKAFITVYKCITEMCLYRPFPN